MLLLNLHIVLFGQGFFRLNSMIFRERDCAIVIRRRRGNFHNRGAVPSMGISLMCLETFLA